MKYIFIFTSIFLLIFSHAFSQNFRIPMESLYITSSFGEYKDTGDNPHFHKIDFSSFSKVGLPVKSAESGFVYKIWLTHLWQHYFYLSS
ncbi:hypothetical protein [Marinitoga litoralis]|uniref:hypothetical protein n=1 Tax=Marinitoga litoralis TaxID=570855 RepID=UPI0019613DF3|nr:hypothetical protein [Marinitoga litoralis]MBM7559754.1 murein DD-endopeptidase MepM/ murein hydrolase activator NlpD [Marinitoga litoralis]